jgi:hypothetical protein
MSRYDDILDSLADQYQDRDDFTGKPRVRWNVEQLQQKHMEVWLRQQDFAEMVDAIDEEAREVADEDWVIG